MWVGGDVLAHDGYSWLSGPLKWTIRSPSSAGVFQATRFFHRPTFDGIAGPGGVTSSERWIRKVEIYCARLVVTLLADPKSLRPRQSGWARRQDASEPGDGLPERLRFPGPRQRLCAAVRVALSVGVADLGLNMLGRMLRPVFTKKQLRRLAHDNGFSTESFPAQLTVHQWSSVFEFMVRAVPQGCWPMTGPAARRAVERIG